jgi:hypothetical protein
MSSVTSALSARRPESGNGTGALQSGNETPARRSGRGLVARIRSGFGKLRAAAFPRYLIAFLVGIGATLAWQAYAGPARKTIAGWSPRLAFLAPPAPGVASDQIKATSLALAAVHQSVDKLASEVGKLETQAGTTGSTGSDRSAPAAAPSRRSRGR